MPLLPSQMGAFGAKPATATPHLQKWEIASGSHVRSAEDVKIMQGREAFWARRCHEYTHAAAQVTHKDQDETAKEVCRRALFWKRVCDGYGLKKTPKPPMWAGGGQPAAPEQAPPGRL